MPRPSRYFCAVAAAAVLAAAPSSFAAPADWMGVAGAGAERVGEPVFDGEVMLYRAGRRGAEPVVLIHGLGLNGARDWAGLIPALAVDHEVFALDLPGFGESSKGNQLYSPANFAEVIEAVVPEKAGRPFTLIGHSMGGAVALAYAAAHPERLSRLILVDMAGVLHRSSYAEFLGRFAAERVSGMYPQGAPWFDHLTHAIVMRAENLSIDTRMLLQIPPLRQRLFRGDPNAIAAYALVEHDFSRALRAVRTPTLLIWGGADKVAPLRTGQMAAAVIPGARLLVIPGAGHAPQLEVPERFNAFIRDELRGKLALQPYALKTGVEPGQRVASCDGASGRRYTGEFRQLTLNGCRAVEIENAHIGSLVATNSEVRIVNSEISGGIDARNSRLELSAGVVKGDPALMLDSSQGDIAGTRFETGSAVARNRGSTPLALHVSVAETLRPGGTPRYVHEIVRLSAGQDWHAAR